MTAVVAACSTSVERRETVVRGETMGTTYTVRVVARPGASPSPRTLRTEVDGELRRVEDTFSTYDPGSEISRFNRHPAGEPFPVSPEMMEVVTAARRMFEATGGAFDPTVGPLVRLWGFGPGEPIATPPSPAAVENCLARVGFDRVAIGPGAVLTKATQGLELDLSGIAKGYGVDRVARLLADDGWGDFLVEIGGEVAVRGRNVQGRPWRLAIEAPTDSLLDERAAWRKVELSQGALATSGDYRRFFEYDGVRYAHVIDPATGRPVPQSVRSASVIAADCATADAAATALLVLGPERGLAWAEGTPGLEALLIVRDEAGRLVERRTSGMGACLAE